MALNEDESKLLARIDERTLHVMGTVKQLADIVEAGYVTKQEFAPVKNVIFGMVSFILISVLGAVIALVIMRK